MFPDISYFSDYLWAENEAWHAGMALVSGSSFVLATIVAATMAVMAKIL